MVLGQIEFGRSHFPSLCGEVRQEEYVIGSWAFKYENIFLKQEVREDSRSEI